MKLYAQPKKAKLKANFALIEVSLEDDVHNTSEAVKFYSEMSILVLGESHQNKVGTMLIIYSEEKQEATTVIDKYVEFEEVTEQ